MKFPILQGEKAKYPDTNKCAWCKGHKAVEPHSMAILAGGAILMNRKTGDGGPNDRLDGFLGLTWHGAHSSDGGIGVHPNIYATLEIAKDIKGGQFDIAFCSTRCLRAFLNYAVDKLEEKMKRTKTRT